MNCLNDIYIPSLYKERYQCRKALRKQFSARPAMLTLQDLLIPRAAGHELINWSLEDLQLPATVFLIDTNIPFDIDIA